MDVSELPVLLETELQVSAEGEIRPFEVIIQAYRWHPALGLYLQTGSKMSVGEYQGTYTDAAVLTDIEKYTNVYSTRAFQRRNFGLLIESANVTDGEGTYYSSGTPLEIVVTLREVPLACWMQVTYWGDVEGTNSGDLAYFNNFLKEGSLYAEQGGVYRATGSAADPAAQPLIDQFMDIAGGAEPTSVFSEEVAAANSGSAFDPFSGNSNPELEELVEQNNEAQQQQQQQATSEFAYWIGGKGRVPDPELETFGVSLVGRQVSQTDDTGQRTWHGEWGSSQLPRYRWPRRAPTVMDAGNAGQGNLE